MITKAGQQIVDKYRRLAASPSMERHMTLVDGLGEKIPGKWMRVGVGNGAELSAAMKLANDGYATMRGGRHNHWIMVH